MNTRLCVRMMKIRKKESAKDEEKKTQQTEITTVPLLTSIELHKILSNSIYFRTI